MKHFWIGLAIFGMAGVVTTGLAWGLAVVVGPVVEKAAHELRQGAINGTRDFSRAWEEGKRDGTP